jgi:hypothetical protein
MATTVNDFNVWEVANTVPLMDFVGNDEFDVWDVNTPLLDIDESNPNAQPRRRAQVI